MDCNLKHLQSYRLQLGIFDGPMTLRVNLPIVDRIHSKGNYSNCSLLRVGRSRLQVTQNLMTAASGMVNEPQ